LQGAFRSTVFIFRVSLPLGRHLNSGPPDIEAGRLAGHYCNGRSLLRRAKITRPGNRCETSVTNILLGLLGSRYESTPIHRYARNYSPNVVCHTPESSDKICKQLQHMTLTSQSHLICHVYHTMPERAHTHTARKRNTTWVIALTSFIAK